LNELKKYCDRREVSSDSPPFERFARKRPRTREAIFITVFPIPDFLRIIVIVIVSLRDRRDRAE
jgi:hypothetical protein